MSSITLPLPHMTRLPGRRFAARLVGGKPEVTNGAAGSAIKGINVVSAFPVKHPVPPVSGESTVVEQHPASPQTGFEPHVAAKTPGIPGFAAGVRLHHSPIALSVFTISRDQRLSRWDLVEEDKSLSTSIPETPGDGADSSSSAGLGGEGNCATRNADVVVVAASDELRALSLQRQEKKVEQRRWRLRWRAGCVTDVCDISGLDVITVVDDSQRDMMGDESSDNLPCSLTTLEQGKGATIKLNEQSPSPAEEEGSASPAALVAVSGQGLQLVLFGAC